ncbi:MAG: efflux RND transporter permease subunit [Gemmatimonadetes bacterium]|nr:efflux RND transporter permease subunit [Gemmatimonadota bacterium]MYB67366.1 efflux RND transporter permease subunit [Gemmatimonadota bacterium]
MSKTYIALLGFCCKHRRIMLALLVLLWGVPVWLLPDSIGEDGAVARAYEEWWMDPQFDEETKPLLFKVLGGASYLFFQKVHKGEVFGRNEEQSLRIVFTMPSNVPIQKMEELCFGFEAALAPYMEQIEKVAVNYSSKSALMEIVIAEEADRLTFPQKVYAALARHAANVGGVGISVSGFGLQHHQSLLSDFAQFSLKATGSDYLKLREISEQFADKLAQNRRIRDVDIDAVARYSTDEPYEMIGRLDADAISAYGLDIDRVAEALRQQTTAVSRKSLWVAGELQDVAIKFRGADVAASDEVKGVELGDHVRLGDLIRLEKSRIQPEIVREDQTYMRRINLNYLGSREHGEKLIDLLIDRTEFPYGFSIARQASYWYLEEDNRKELMAILGVAVLVVWMIAACLFESWSKPFLVLLAVPMALIGLFDAFYFLGASFDTGGYIAVLFLAGIAVNNAFLMLYQMDEKAKAAAGDLEAEVFAAAAHRLKPIAITTLTTLAGLLPIVLFEDTESIWYPLAVGVTGGLVASAVLLPIYLPMLYLGLHRKRS